MRIISVVVNKQDAAQVALKLTQLNVQVKTSLYGEDYLFKVFGEEEGFDDLILRVGYNLGFVQALVEKVEIK
jgi:hypothetical protein